MWSMFKKALRRREPQVGDIYQLDNQEKGNPFNTPVYTHILEVKNGWVRYGYGYRYSVFNTESNQSMRTKYFLGSYFLIEEAENEQSTTTD